MPRLLNTEEQKEKARAYYRAWMKTPKGRQKIKRDNRARWLQNPEALKAAAKRYYARRSALLSDLKNKPCADCHGWFESYQMDFDHRDSKTKIACVGQIVSCGLKKLLEEIAKCDLVCANCHRKRTHERGQYDSKTNTARYINRHFLPRSARTNENDLRESA